MSLCIAKLPGIDMDSSTVDTSTVLSAIAIIVSVASALIAYSLQRSDSQRSAREQLSESVAELINLNSKNYHVWSTAPEHRNATYYQEISSISQIAASITRQAVFLVNSYPDMVTDVDYVAIAQGLTLVGDNVLADTYMQNAISKSPSNFYRIINLRGYADFLFRQGRHELAREKYQEAVKIFDNNTDFNKATNGYTYQMWMNSEYYSGFSSESDSHYQRAIGIYNSISNQMMKTYNINSLGQARAAFQPQGSA
jgi:tetratricopeptide (TPR) repeat protein